MPDLSREEAIALLRQQRASTLALMEHLPSEARNRPGIGGGEWSATDLLGHLESWEDHLLSALAAWAEHQRAPIHVALEEDGLDAVNAAEVARRAGRSYEEQLASTLTTRQRLIEALQSIDDGLWSSRPDAAMERTMADLAGSLVGSDSGPFTHDQAHHAELREFVLQHQA